MKLVTFLKVTCPVVATLFIATASQATLVTATSNPLWTDSGITVTPGEVLNVAWVSGRWDIGFGNFTGPAGLEPQAAGDGYDKFFAGALHGGLIGHVGTSAPNDNMATSGYFAFIDGTTTITILPGSSGTLWFGMNDDQQSGAVGDNKGSLLLDVTTVSAVPEPSTVMAGACLLLPFGASALRLLRKKRAA